VAKLPPGLAPMHFAPGASVAQPEKKGTTMFQEYPKWLYPEGQEPVLVHSHEQEVAVNPPEQDVAEPAAPAEAEAPKNKGGRPRKAG
jgi:hypothetical protein